MAIRDFGAELAEEFPEKSHPIKVRGGSDFEWFRVQSSAFEEENVNLDA